MVPPNPPFPKTRKGQIEWSELCYNLKGRSVSADAQHGAWPAAMAFVEEKIERDCFAAAKRALAGEEPSSLPSTPGWVQEAVSRYFADLGKKTSISVDLQKLSSKFGRREDPRHQAIIAYGHFVRWASGKENDFPPPRKLAESYALIEVESLVANKVLLKHLAKQLEHDEFDDMTAIALIKWGRTQTLKALKKEPETLAAHGPQDLVKRAFVEGVATYFDTEGLSTPTPTVLAYLAVRAGLHADEQQEITFDTLVKRWKYVRNSWANSTT